MLCYAVELVEIFPTDPHVVGLDEWFVAGRGARGGFGPR